MSKVVLSDEKLLSTKKAAELTGYSQDYLGQLCRSGTLECRFIGRQWYVLESSIKKYAPRMRKPKKSDYFIFEGGVDTTPNKKQKKQTNKENKKDTQQQIETQQNKEQEFLIKDTKADTFEVNGEIYISTKKAIELTGYSQDYVGQLARKKEIRAIKSGKRWFVHKQDLQEHKKQKDSMLAKVQADSVGLNKKAIFNSVPQTDTLNIDLGIKYLGHEEADNPFERIQEIDNLYKIEYVEDTPEFANSLSYSSEYISDNLDSKLHISRDEKMQTWNFKDVQKQNSIDENKKENAKKHKIYETQQNKDSVIVWVKFFVSVLIFAASLSMFLLALKYVYLG